MLFFIIIIERKNVLNYLNIFIRDFPFLFFLFYFDALSLYLLFLLYVLLEVILCKVFKKLLLRRVKYKLQFV